VSSMVRQDGELAPSSGLTPSLREIGGFVLSAEWHHGAATALRSTYPTHSALVLLGRSSWGLLKPSLVCRRRLGPVARAVRPVRPPLAFPDACNPEPQRVAVTTFARLHCVREHD
jgi:hypothetical protein